MWDQQTANRIAHVLDRHPELTLVYLFGSRADDRAGPESDYDFGVLAGSIRDTQAFRTQLAHELGIVLNSDSVDVVMLDRVPVELAYSVIAQGKLIYQRDTATRVEFEAGVMGRYGDYLPVLRAQREDIYRGGDHAARVRRYREALGRIEREIGEIRASQREASR